MTDNDLMPFGIHKDKKMSAVPDSYLYWLHTNKKASKEVQEYINDNLDAIKKNLGDDYIYKTDKIKSTLKEDFL